MLSHEEFFTQIAAQLHSQDLTPNPATRSLPVAPHVFRLQLSEFFLDFGNFRTILREDPCQVLVLHLKVISHLETTP